MTDRDDLADRRAAKAAAADDLLTCRCGSQWFTLEPGPDSPAAVALDLDRGVIAYGGTLVCADCRRTLPEETPDGR